MKDAMVVGFYGKLPSHGDFLHHSVSDHFVDAWDRWLQHALVASKTQLQDRWLPTYLTSPAWRFVLSRDTIDGHAWAGVLLPSVDRVGRYFPFTVVAPLPPMSAFLAASVLHDWFQSVERLAFDALETELFDLRAFEQAIGATAQQVGDLLAPYRFDERSGGETALQASVRGFPDGAPCWRFDLQSLHRLDRSLGEIFGAVVASSLEPLALWWSEGSDQVAPSWLCTRGLPEPGRFTAMLSGNWSDGWSGALAIPGAHSGHPSPQQASITEAGDDAFGSESSPRLQLTSGSQTDAGKRRASNQDASVQRDDIGVWAVADGMGGHRHGDVASRMIADAIAGMNACGSLTAQVEATRSVLSAVNARLRRMAERDPEHFDAGSTVVALLVRGEQGVVLWAGDSRLYRWRDGIPEQLTIDHTVAYELALQAGRGDFGADVGSSNEITRAVGGEDVLEIDSRRIDVRAGDRLLLCSDGVYNELTLAALGEAMSRPSATEAAGEILQEISRTPARDNATALCIFAR